jgi:pimeloyl-ACP methyl ester carboxylesterase
VGEPDDRLPRPRGRSRPRRRDPVVRLLTREWGRDGDAKVVCWGGLNLSAHAHYDEAAPILAQRFGLHVQAVEPPGWTSPPLAPEGYRPSSLGALLPPLLAPRGVFLGWSWGATIGAHLGALGPEALAGLVLLDAGYTDLQDEPRFRERSLDELRDELQAATVRFESWEAYLDAARARARTWRPALEARARAAMCEEDGAVVPLVAPDTLAAGLHGVAVERPSAALGAVRCPLLLVVASETVAQLGEKPLERFRAAVPRAEVITIDSSHDVLADALEPTLDAVGGFVTRILAA